MELSSHCTPAASTSSVDGGRHRHHHRHHHHHRATPTDGRASTTIATRSAVRIVIPLSALLATALIVAVMATTHVAAIPAPRFYYDSLRQSQMDASPLQLLQLSAFSDSSPSRRIMWRNGGAAVPTFDMLPPAGYTPEKRRAAMASEREQSANNDNNSNNNNNLEAAAEKRQELLVGKKYDRNCFFSPVQCMLSFNNNANDDDIWSGRGRK